MTVPAVSSEVAERMHASRASMLIPLSADAALFPLDAYLLGWEPVGGGKIIVKTHRFMAETSVHRMLSIMFDCRQRY